MISVYLHTADQTYYLLPLRFVLEIRKLQIPIVIADLTQEGPVLRWWVECDFHIDRQLGLWERCGLGDVWEVTKVKVKPTLEGYVVYVIRESRTVLDRCQRIATIHRLFTRMQGRAFVRDGPVARIRRSVMGRIPVAHAGKSDLRALKRELIMFRLIPRCLK